jgi:two-component system chemotaxis response regulator CheY
MAHILAVDDSRSMRQMVTFTLQAAGHQITEAEDGQQAYDIAQTGQFDLVLADVNMPRMDGISLVKKLREMPAFKFTPILMLTTEAGSDKKTEGRSAGATGWIVKPFNPDQLLSTISRVLG